MVRIIVAVCMLYYVAIGNTIFSQENVITIQDMISNFQTFQSANSSKLINDSMHLVKGFQERESFITNKDLLLSSELKMSMEHNGTEWDLVYTPSANDPLRRTLTLVKIKGINGMYLMEKLAEKYGRNEKGVPAFWYSGKVCVLSCPRNLFGEIVTKEKKILTISQGVIETQLNVPIKVGSMENIPINGVMTLDGCWYNSMQYHNLHPLDEFVNYKKKESAIKTYTISLLLVTNEQGRASGYVLSLNKIKDKEEKKMVDALLKRISHLPPWSFGWMETIDGKIFQGRYLKATYSSNAGWTFEDYI